MAQVYKNTSHPVKATNKAGNGLRSTSSLHDKHKRYRSRQPRLLSSQPLDLRARQLSGFHEENIQPRLSFFRLVTRKKTAGRPVKILADMSGFSVDRKSTASRGFLNQDIKERKNPIGLELRSKTERRAQRLELKQKLLGLYLPRALERGHRPL